MPTHCPPGLETRWDSTRYAPSVAKQGVSNEAGQPNQPIASAVTRLNAIGPYYTMFPLEFPLDALANAGPDTWVLDPFCGRGTTLFAARLRGVPSVGIDVSPVAAALAAAKLASANADDVVAYVAALLSDAAGVDLPSGEFWDLAFHRTTLRQLVAVRNALLGAKHKLSVMTRALLLGILHGPINKGLPSYLSNQMPRTYATKPASAVRYWRTRGLHPPAVDLLDVVRRRADWVLDTLPPESRGLVVNGDCRHALPDIRTRFSWVVTSPPYLGMRTYVPDQWLRSWFLGGPPDVDYTSEGQIGRWAIARFVRELAACWRSVAKSCVDGAVLIVRFGALPSLQVDPSEVLTDSLHDSGMPWRVLGSAPAGVPPRRARQATQFTSAGSVVEEVDLIARLG